MWQHIVETTCILIWVWDQPQRGPIQLQHCPSEPRWKFVETKTRCRADRRRRTRSYALAPWWIRCHRSKWGPVSRRQPAQKWQLWANWHICGSSHPRQTRPQPQPHAPSCSNATRPMNRTPWHPRQDSGPQTTGSWLARQGVDHPSLSSPSVPRRVERRLC